MTTYSFDKLFAPPRPMHALTPGAVAGVEVMRQMAADRRLEALMGDVVLTPPRPYLRDPVTSDATKLRRVAEERGFRTQVLTTDFDGVCIVQGVRLGDRVGFTAKWARGRSVAAAWVTPRRFEMIEDDRPIGVDKLKLVGLKDHRARGIGRRRLTQRGWEPMGIRALLARVESLDRISSPHGHQGE